jgi:hypothetical protein
MPRGREPTGLRVQTPAAEALGRPGASRNPIDQRAATRRKSVHIKPRCIDR